MVSNQDQETYSKGEVLSMLEGIDDGIKIISEQHTGIIERLDGIDGRLDGIDGRLDGIDTRLDKIDGRLDRIESDVVDIKHELKHKVDHEEFEKLENRVIKLEKLVVAG